MLKRSKERKVLTGQRNQCSSCLEYFNSNYAFDRHRAGDFGVDRRCLIVEEMTAKGMVVNALGFWVSGALPLGRLGVNDAVSSKG